MSETAIWLVIVLIGAGTFLLRFSLIALLDRLGRTPPSLERALRFIPPAVLSALVVPALLHHDGALAIGPRLGAGLVAIAVAWKSKNVLATITAGMLVLWGLQAFG